MGYSFVLGDDVVVSAEEFNEKMSLGSIARFKEEAKSNMLDARLEFQRGTVTAAELAEGGRRSGGQPLPFQEIGIGKPVSIEVLGFYTGKLPFWFGFGKSDLMITSAIKSIETYGAQPKAINQIVKDVDDRQLLRTSAEADGSPIVYYKPSLVNSTVTCDINLIVDSFDENLFRQLSSLLRSAAGLPLFVAGPQGPAVAGAALAGSVLVTLAGELGKTLAESKPMLQSALELRFDTPDFFRVRPGTIVVYNSLDGKEFAGFAPRLVDPGTATQHMVLQKDGETYEGNAPYVILSLDGRELKDLNDFAPTIASAALLEQFMGGDDPTGKALSVLEQAMELYNDYTFNKKGNSVKAAMGELDPESDSYADDKKELEELLNAYNQNIRNELFRLLG